MKKTKSRTEGLKAPDAVEAAGGVITTVINHWFEDGKAPYAVYSVETGQLIEPK